MSQNVVKINDSELQGDKYLTLRVFDRLKSLLEDTKETVSEENYP